MYAGVFISANEGAETQAIHIKIKTFCMINGKNHELGRLKNIFLSNTTACVFILQQKSLKASDNYVDCYCFFCFKSIIKIFSVNQIFNSVIRF